MPSDPATCMARSTCRCSARRSGRTWTAPPRACRTRRRWSCAARACAGPIASWSSGGGLRRRAAGAGAASAATASASGRSTTPNGCSPSSPPPRPGSSWSTSTRPTALTELEFALNKVGCAALVTATRVQDQRLPRHAAELLPELPRSARRAAGRAPAGPAHRDPDRRRQPGHHPVRRRAWPGHGRAPAGWPAAADAAVRRPDQHPVHQRHHRQPEGRHAHPPQHPQQRLLHRRGHAPDGRGPALHPGAALPLLRHGARQPGLRSPTAPPWSIPARASTRSPRWRPWRPSAAPALHGVPTMFIAEMEHPEFAASTCRACAPASWPARPARSR